jgi:capsular exopolysaccharide synthesis family protein
MGKTHEALERAEKEYSKKLIKMPTDSQKKLVVKEPKRFPIQTPLDQYHEIKGKLITCFSERSIKTILIVGVDEGSGTSSTAIGFATTLARDCRLKVLLIDANLRSPSLHEFFKIERNIGLSNILTEKIDETKLFIKAGHGDLYIIPCGKNCKGPLSIFESEHFEKKLKMMSEEFDCVILDAPPVNSSIETKVMSKKVEGVILVVESGRTRSPVAIKAKKELEEAGANILGVILNRRRQYIPEWIYKRL